MTTDLQTHLREASMKDKGHKIHSFRVGTAASYNMDGTAMDPLMEDVRSKSSTVARRYVRPTASAAAVGVTRSREMALIDAAVLPMSKTNLNVSIQRFQA